MKRKIIGIFVIAILTISYMPIINSETSQVPESYESKGGDIKFFFIGKVNGGSIGTVPGKIFLAILGIYIDVGFISLNVEGSNLFLFDGETMQLEPPCAVKLYNVKGISIPRPPFCSLIFRMIKGIIFSDITAIEILLGSCESYEIQN